MDIPICSAWSVRSSWYAHYEGKYAMMFLLYKCYVLVQTILI